MVIILFLNNLSSHSPFFVSLGEVFTFKFFLFTLHTLHSPLVARPTLSAYWDLQLFFSNCCMHTLSRLPAGDNDSNTGTYHNLYRSYLYYADGCSLRMVEVH